MDNWCALCECEIYSTLETKSDFCERCLGKEVEENEDYCICGHHYDSHWYDSEMSSLTPCEDALNDGSLCPCKDYMDKIDPDNFIS